MVKKIRIRAAPAELFRDPVNQYHPVFLCTYDYCWNSLRSWQCWLQFLHNV